MIHRLRASSDALRSSFLFLPAIAVAIGFVAARLLVGVDAGQWVGRSTVDSARSVLSTTAAATITFASVTFSVSLLIIQQGSNQFSPRVIHGLVRDPFNRRVIAIVVGTFTYCLVSLQRVRGPVAEGGEEVVPEFAVAMGLLLGVISVLAVVAAINHTSRKMDISVILGDIVDECRSVRPAVDDAVEPMLVSHRSVPDDDFGTLVRFDTDGWVRHIDRRSLIELTEPGGTIRLEIDTGRYAIRSTALCTIWPAVPTDRLDEVSRSAHRAVVVGPSRTMSDDPGYGPRQLVDVALKALSPGINDPTTAQDAIFHLGAVLVDRLTSAPVPAAFRDQSDRQLLTPHAMTDEELAQLSIAELRRASTSLPAVAIYLLQMVGLVAEAAAAGGSPERAEPFIEQARHLIAGVEASQLLAVDRDQVRDTYETLFSS